MRPRKILDAYIYLHKTKVEFQKLCDTDEKNPLTFNLNCVLTEGM